MFLSYELLQNSEAVGLKRVISRVCSGVEGLAEHGVHHESYGTGPKDLEHNALHSGRI